MTAPAAGSRRRALTALCAGWAVAGTVALVAAVLLDAPSRAGTWVAVGLALALVAAQLFPLHLTHEGDSEALRLEEALFVPMLWLLHPGELLGAVAVAVGVAAVSSRRGLLKGAFNVGMTAATAGLGVGTALLLGLDGPLGAADLAAVSAGALVYCLSSAVAVAVVISVAQGAPVRALLLQGLGVRVATWFGSISLGVLVLLATDRSPAALLVAVVPAAVLQVAFAGALRQWRERQDAEALYEAAGRIRASVDSSQVRSELVVAARQLLAAGTARVVHDTAEPVPAAALRIPLDDRTAVEVTDRATGGAWTRGDTSRLQALAGVAGGALANALLYEQLQAVTGSLGEGVLALDADGDITLVNPAAARLLGRRADELIGAHVTSALEPGARSGAAWVHLPRLRAGETLRLDEHLVVRSDGEAVDVALTASPVVRDGEVVGAVLALRDVRERVALERRLRHQAFHDQLTGLPNRALFLDRLEHAQAAGSDRGRAVLLVDLDHLKVLNDDLGHAAGDDVLGTVASRLAGAVGPGDTVARFGGDEFAVLLEGVADRAAAVAAADRLLAAVRVPLRAGDAQVVVSASAGVAFAAPGASAVPRLLAEADAAMQAAKSAGRDRTCSPLPTAVPQPRAELAAVRLPA